MLEDKIFLVRDARIDPRVHDSNFADTWVFYAGIPLRFEGHRVGVLCVGDTQPGDLDEDGEATLRDLAGMVEQELSVARMSEIQLALARSNKELEMKANVDVLTRIWNRRAILEIAENEHRRVRTPATLAVLMIDIDHFKKVNDTYGHPAGDEVLRAVGERLRSSIRSTDAVGRLGGEEFLVIMIDAQESEVARLAEAIRANVAREPVSFEGRPIALTCSVGFVTGGTEHSIDTLIRHADQALYRAKANGRNRVEAA